MFSNRDVLIWLNHIGINNRSIRALYNRLENISEIWDLSMNELGALKIIQKSVIDRIIKHRNNKSAQEIFNQLQEKGIKVYTIEDDNYPERLKYIDDNPLVLYSKGDYIDEEFTIAIVGSRKATAYGKWVCGKFTRELSKLGITIVSGLAQGIDTIAHTIALEEGTKAIGVLGNGIDIIYPKKNMPLYKKMEDEGCILTEFPLGTQPLSYNFPQRNRIISGLSLGIIVIEAQEKSGSLITAHHGLEQGKDIFAVPGNINSIYSGGTNKLIKDGASPLLEIDDILEGIYEFRNIKREKKKERLDYSEFSDDEIKIIELLKDEPAHSDILTIKTGYNISTVMSILTGLELKGIIKELSRNIFTLS